MSARHVSELLASWNAFYAMIGSSAAALTGLMFVVISLTSRHRSTQEGVATFNTPTVVHFSVAILVAATIAAPFRSLTGPRTMLALIGVAGIVYVLRLATIAKRFDAYTLDFEDWSCNVVLPIVAYVAMLASSLALSILPQTMLFAVAGSVLLLIFVGIHNAWDVVTYIALGRSMTLRMDNDDENDENSSSDRE